MRAWSRRSRRGWRASRSTSFPRRRESMTPASWRVESCLDARLRGHALLEHDQCIGGGEAAAGWAYEDRVDVHFAEARGERCGHLRHRDERARQRVLVGGGLAAIAV